MRMFLQKEKEYKESTPTKSLPPLEHPPRSAAYTANTEAITSQTDPLTAKTALLRLRWETFRWTAPCPQQTQVY